MKPPTNVRFNENLPTFREKTTKFPEDYEILVRPLLLRSHKRVEFNQQISVGRDSYGYTQHVKSHFPR